MSHAPLPRHGAEARACSGDCGPAPAPQVPADQADFHKTQTLMWKNGYSVVAKPPPCSPPAPARCQGAGAGASPGGALLGPAPSAPAAAAPPAATSPDVALPSWIQFEKKVLRFYAFFEEAVPDSPTERWRVRRVQLLHYLGDGTTQVVEPRDGSGMPQGTLVLRRRIPRHPPLASAAGDDDGAAAAADGDMLGPQDLSVGGTVVIHARELRIVDADPFTREFMAARGAPQGPPLPYPASQIDEYKAQRSKPSGARPAPLRVSSSFNVILRTRSSTLRSAPARAALPAPRPHPQRPAEPQPLRRGAAGPRALHQGAAAVSGGQQPCAAVLGGVGRPGGTGFERASRAPPLQTSLFSRRQFARGGRAAERQRRPRVLPLCQARAAAQGERARCAPLALAAARVARNPPLPPPAPAEARPTCRRVAAAAAGAGVRAPGAAAVPRRVRGPRRPARGRHPLGARPPLLHPRGRRVHQGVVHGAQRQAWRVCAPSMHDTEHASPDSRLGALLRQSVAPCRTIASPPLPPAGKLGVLRRGAGAGGRLPAREDAAQGPAAAPQRSGRP
jgi:hypothetical protein